VRAGRRLDTTAQTKPAVIDRRVWGRTLKCQNPVRGLHFTWEQREPDLLSAELRAAFPITSAGALISRRSHMKTYWIATAAAMIAVGFPARLRRRRSKTGWKTTAEMIGKTMEIGQ